MDWSLSKIIRIETGGVGISTSDLRQLLQLYEVTDEAEVADLVELARVGRQRPWWTRYRGVLPPGYLDYVGLEDESSALRIIALFGLPGLLQTREYAHAALEAASWGMEVELRRQVPPEVARDRVTVRMTRQNEVLRRPDGPPEITVILDEGVLWRQVGGPDVLRRQLERLMTLSNEPYMTIQVLPFTASMVNIIGHFVIMEFPDPADPDAVYVEAPFNPYVVEGEDVARYRKAFERLRQASLSPDESRELMKRIASSLR